MSTSDKKYKVLDYDITSSSRDMYKRAIAAGVEKECFIGRDENYRFLSKGEMFITKTNMRALLDYCIYPLYKEGDKEIANRAQYILSDMVSSKDPLQIIQVLEFIYTQEKNALIYSDLPCYIKTDKCFDALPEIIEANKDAMIAFKEGDFAICNNDVYNMAKNYLEDINLLKKGIY